MKETILSVGIDIGTSTTQLIFSKLTIENEASSYVVPRINIVDKEVTYRSKIYFTPLLSQTEIDAEKVKKIIEAFCYRRDKTMIMVTHYENELPQTITNRLFLKRNR